jgi:hypothetical protein
MNRGRLLILVTSAVLFRTATAHAATLTVNSGADAGGTCPGATCTLRQAILVAASGDTINFAAGIATIDLTSSELGIDKNLTITGPGANLLIVERSAANGIPPFRIFSIAPGNFNVTVSGLTIANGSATDGAGIYNSSGTLTVATCTISGNFNNGCGGGFGCGVGGGVFNDTGGTVNITDSTLSRNGGGNGGGGIFNKGGMAIVTNSTISGNFGGATGGGGGIFNDTGGTINLTNSTISGNDGTGFTGAAGGAGGIRNDAGGTVNARNTIIAKNIKSGAAYDVGGPLTSQGYNLIGNNNGATIVPMTGDQIGTPGSPIDPKLGPLQDNGGPTFTQALLSGSTAIDGGHSSGSNTDQRGLPRPVDNPGIPNAIGGDGSDIGAFEVQTISATPTPTPTPTATPTASPTARPAAKSLNISTRSRVQTGDNVMIGGFIVTGNVSKKVIVRALGPSLQGSGLTGVLADPVLELHGPNGSVIASDDNWRDDPDQALQIQASGIPPQDDLESAIVITLPPAGYTAVVSGKSNGTGLGLVEVYDLDQTSDAELANISTRAVVETGNNVIIGGFILGGANASPEIIVRAIGPSLGGLGIVNPLPDPTLELRDGNGMLIAFDDNWRDNPAQAAQIIAAGLQPQNDLEAAIVATLPPGAYTAIVAGRNAGTGVGLVEVYNLQ